MSALGQVRSCTYWLGVNVCNGLSAVIQHINFRRSAPGGRAEIEGTREKMMSGYANRQFDHNKELYVRIHV